MLIILREDNLFSHMDKKSKRETLRVLDMHSRYFKGKEKLRERGILWLAASFHMEILLRVKLGLCGCYLMQKLSFIDSKHRYCI